MNTYALFWKYPMASYATDVNFQPCNCPSGNLSESKRYFSKHGVYGYKFEASVLPNRLSIGCSAQEPEYASTFCILQDRRHFHKEQLKRCSKEFDLEDGGPLEDAFSDTWCILLHKGYQDSKEFCRTIHRTKKSRTGVLSLSQVAEDQGTLSVCVLVENYFWGMLGI